MRQIFSQESVRRAAFADTLTSERQVLWEWVVPSLHRISISRQLDRDYPDIYCLQTATAS